MTHDPAYINVVGPTPRVGGGGHTRGPVYDIVIITIVIINLFVVIFSRPRACRSNIQSLRRAVLRLTRRRG